MAQTFFKQIYFFTEQAWTTEIDVKYATNAVSVVVGDPEMWPHTTAIKQFKA
jgi:hypothetical protein